MRRKNGIPAILYPLPKIVKNIKTIGYSGGTAVQFDLDTEGFTYQKWGGAQTCRTGDWLVDNNGEVYTVSRQSFETTYASLGPGVYYKAATLWARQAIREGEIDTHEGKTHYLAGDYILYNNPDQTDGYAVAREQFATMYEPWNEGA